MRKDKEKWLDQQIDKELDAMADVRERLLMEMEELRDIEMPEEKLADIHRELEARERAAKSLRKSRVRFRMAAALAAVLVLLVGAGVVGNSAKLYVPEIFQSMKGNEVEINVENTEVTSAQYDEEEVLEEIKKKLGVVPIRLGYYPKGMSLKEYEIFEDDGEAFIRYGYAENTFYIMLNKKHNDFSMQRKTDGEVVDTLTTFTGDIEVPVYCYQDSGNQSYFSASFEYLNTYYYITGMMEQEEFTKIIENLLIKSD